MARKTTAKAVAEAPVEVKADAVETSASETVETESEKKETAPKKTSSARTAAKKTDTAAKKTTAKTEGPNTQVLIQFSGNEATVESVIEKIKNEYVSEGHRASSIKDLRVYLKPMDGLAYYVINEKVAGSVDLF